MSTLVILQCTGKKVSGGKVEPVLDPFEFLLGPTRKQLVAEFSQILNSAELMPAYLRYGAFQKGRQGGLLYTNMNWSKTLTKIQQGSLDVLIVSALYGVLKYDTPIAYYDLRMSDSGRQWLIGNQLGNCVQHYIAQKTNITHIKSFVSDHYFAALGQFVPSGSTYLGNDWIRYDRGARVAKEHINPFIDAI